MRSYGDIDTENKVIRVNKKASRQWGRENKKAGILDTIVHEEMHREHPRMGERTIRKKTKEKVKRMTRKQKAQYYSKYSILKGKKK